MYLGHRFFPNRARVELQYRHLASTMDLSNTLAEEYTEIHLRLVCPCLLHSHCCGYYSEPDQC